MRLHVFDNPGDTTAHGINVWVTECPPDFTDEEVRWNVEQWAQGGDACAKQALALVPGYWLGMGTGDRTVRVYRDD